MADSNQAELISAADADTEMRDKFLEEIEEALKMQERVEDALATLYERLSFYSLITDDGYVTHRIHPRIKRAFLELQGVLEESAIISCPVMAPDEE